MSSIFTAPEINRILAVKKTLKNVASILFPDWLEGFGHRVVMADSPMIMHAFHSKNSFRISTVPFYMLDCETCHIEWDRTFESIVHRHESSLIRHKILRNTVNKSHNEQMMFIRHPDNTSGIIIPTKLKTREELVAQTLYLHTKPSYQPHDDKLFISRDMYDSIARKVTYPTSRCASPITSSAPSDFLFCEPESFHKTIKKRPEMFEDKPEEVV
jgi:hypothetical protein